MRRPCNRQRLAPHPNAGALVFWDWHPKIARLTNDCLKPQSFQLRCQLGEPMKYKVSFENPYCRTADIRCTTEKMQYGLFPVIRCAPPERRLVVECREKDRFCGSFRVALLHYNSQGSRKSESPRGPLWLSRASKTLEGLRVALYFPLATLGRSSWQVWIDKLMV